MILLLEVRKTGLERPGLSYSSGVAGDQVSIEQLGAPVEVNEIIRDFLAQTVEPADGSVWEFLCECGQPGCREHVGLTLELYDELRYTGEPVIARGHLRGRARAARRWSAEPPADSRTVRDQSLHQARHLDLRHRPRSYTLVAKGELNGTLDSAFQGMTVTYENGRTTIVGTVSDQAHLQGLLKRVRERGLGLLSVTGEH